MRYTVVVERDEEGQGWVVHVPALPGCLTQGKTVDEALANAQEAIELHVEALVSDGEPVPEEREPVVSLHQVDVRAA